MAEEPSRLAQCYLAVNLYPELDPAAVHEQHHVFGKSGISSKLHLHHWIQRVQITSENRIRQRRLSIGPPKAPLLCVTPVSNISAQLRGKAFIFSPVTAVHWGLSSAHTLFTIGQLQNRCSAS
jgi:hypothetical protein